MDLSTTVPTRDGYTFRKWLREDLTSWAFDPGAQIPYGWGSFTVIADWIEN